MKLVLEAMVQLVRFMTPLLLIAPPSYDVSSMKEEPVIATVPCPTARPPPESAELPVTAVFVMVRLPLLTKMPPPWPTSALLLATVAPAIVICPLPET